MPRIPKVGMSRSAIQATWMALGIALGLGTREIVAAAGGSVGAITGLWSPRWAIGDVLHSHNLPDATWTVKAILYNELSYQVFFVWAGAEQTTLVSAQNIEGSDIYKV